MMCRNYDFCNITFAHLSFNKDTAFFMFFIEALPAKRLFVITDTVKIAYITLCGKVSSD